MTKDELIVAVIAASAASNYTSEKCDKVVRGFWDAMRAENGVNADAMVAAAVIMAQLAFDGKEPLIIEGLAKVALEALNSLNVADSASSELARIARGRAN